MLAPETDEPGTDRLVSRITTAVARVTAGVDSLGVSAGAAAFPDDGTTLEAVLAAADDRLYDAKRRLPRQRRRARLIRCARGNCAQRPIQPHYPGRDRGRPGMLGKVASAIGSAGGTIGSVDLIKVEGRHTIRE